MDDILINKHAIIERCLRRVHGFSYAQLRQTY